MLPNCKTLLCIIFAVLACLDRADEVRLNSSTYSTLPVVGTNSQAPGGSAGTGTYKYVKHNGKPVISSAVVEFTKHNLRKGSEPSSAVEKYARSLGQSEDDAGHIFANQLGGLAEPINIFPQSPHINRGPYREFEEAIYKCMTEGGAAAGTLKWHFTYSGLKSTRPVGVTYSASFDAGCKHMSQHFDNPHDTEQMVV